MPPILKSYLHVLILVSLSMAHGQRGPRKNVLFFVADDLRPSLGAYLKEGMAVSRSEPALYTPYIDRLAERSIVFNRSYTAMSLCSPSRTSFLTSRRPDTTRIYDLDSYWREQGGNFTTLPQYFKEHGYRTLCSGKIFHFGEASGHNDPISWTDKPFQGEDYYSQNGLLWQAVTETGEQEAPLIDTQITDQALKLLKDVASAAMAGEQPFFLGVGFRKPHSPWNYPERFEDYYPLESLEEPVNYFAPINMPYVAWHNYSKLGTYQNVVDNYDLHGVGTINYTFPRDLTLRIRRAYFSTISFIDSNVGRVLKELDNLGLAENTIVTFIGDHGFHLGENSEWQKATNFEVGTRSPMIINVPGLTDEGSVTSQLVEFVDLFPSLVDLAGLPKMDLCPEYSSNILVCTEGKSFHQLFHDPQHHTKNAAFSQFNHGGDGRNRLDYMGYSMRTDEYRYTEWPEFKTGLKPNWDKINGRELYHHVTDPEENYNVAENPEYQNIRRELSRRLRAGWRFEM